MDRLRLRSREIIKTLPIVVPLAIALLGCDSRPMTAHEIQVRDSILNNPAYHFSQEAKDLLSKDPVYLTQSTNGGGLAHNDEYGIWATCGQDTENPEHRDEACLHEMSHLWNYSQQNVDPTTDRKIIEAFHQVANSRPSGDFWHDLVFGNSRDWCGLNGNENEATESYASGASYSMGNMDQIPSELHVIYSREFNENEHNH